MISIESSSVSRHEIGPGQRLTASAIADHRKEELFHPGSAFDLGAGQGARHRGSVAGKRGRMVMRPIMLFIHILAMFPAVMPVLVPF